MSLPTDANPLLPGTLPSELARLREEARRDYDGMREFQAKFIAANQENTRLREENAQLAAERDSVYRCFHCGFQTSDEAEAAAHFGDRDDEEPICRTWAALNSDRRLQEYQSVQRELTAERNKNALFRTRIDGLEYMLHAYEDLTGSRFKGCKTLDEAFNQFDFMEGRALLAEKAVATLRQQLAGKEGR